MNKIIILLTVILSLACTVSAGVESPSTVARQRVNIAAMDDAMSNLAKNELENAQETAALTSGTLNVRKCPALACSVIGYFSPREVIAVTGAVVRVNTANPRDCAEWYPVKYNGADGFVCAKWVQQ